MEDLKIGISIPTYRRGDGSTPRYLQRALDSINNQTYKNYKIFLIGDRYDDNDEFLKIAKSFPEQEKIYFENLPVAKERDTYDDKLLVWLYGGINATNHSINIALNEGIEYICHLDHDDYWSENHLEEIVKCISETKSEWICTKSTYINGSVLPTVLSSDEYVEFLPLPSGIVHSSVCINFKKIPLLYENFYEIHKKPAFAGDSYLWSRMSEYIKQNNIKSNLINKLTCFKDEERFEMNK
jgi:glycosyltransferase involved in cell wall biosynthesis